MDETDSSPIRKRKRDAAIDHRRRPYSEVVRDRIRSARVIPRLMQCFRGEIVLTVEQVRIGLKLLDKVCPDLKQIEHAGSIEYRHVNEMTEAQIDERLAEIRSQIADGEESTDSSQEASSPIH